MWDNYLDTEDKYLDSDISDWETILDTDTEIV